jgi:hypothetical protein
VAGGALVLGAPVTAAAAAGTPVVVRAGDDAYVSNTRMHSNYGANASLLAGRIGSETRTSYLKFVVPTSSAGLVSGAQLRLPLGKAAAGTVSLLRVPSPTWSEKTITAASAPAVGAVVASRAMTAADKIVTFEVGKVVTGPGAYTFALRSSATGAVARFASAESGTGPELRLTVTPATTPTTAPTTVPATPTPTAPAPTAPAAECVTGALLVPSCGVLWGAAAGGFSSTPRDLALKQWEAATGRTVSIYHTYHLGGEKFPTAAETAMTRDPAHPRVLLLNWKVAYGSTWARVAAGQQDTRIDAFAARIKSTYSERFFLALHHEPESNIDTRAGSGVTAKDYAAMYRHVIQRLRAGGVTNAVNVIAYMGNEKWMGQSWWKDLYPGDDVVDWIGLDSYVSVEKGYYHYGGFGDLLDRKPAGGTGF